MTRLEWVNSVAPYAVMTDLVYGVPASLTLAQAILESGAGRSKLAQEGKNYFGIKGDGKTFATKEYWKGKGWETIEDEFRTYNTKWGSFVDHAQLLSGPRYGKVRELGPSEGAALLQAQGYATDPEYSRKLNTVMTAYDLKRFDKYAPTIRRAGIITLVSVLIIVFYNLFYKKG